MKRLEGMTTHDGPGLAIHAQSLELTLGRHKILDNIDFDLPYDQFCCLIGQSGAGKTTLIKALAGLLPFDGQLEIEDRQGVIFQDSRLLPWKTAKNNIALGVKLDRKSKTRFERVSWQAQNILSDLGLEHLAKRYPYQMSGGEKQRIALARAVCSRPKLLLCDEPFGSLDVFTRQEMQTWLLEIWERVKIAVLFCTHSIEESLFLADRILVMQRGVLTTEYIVPFARPRNRSLINSHEFLDAKNELLALFEATRCDSGKRRLI